MTTTGTPVADDPGPPDASEPAPAATGPTLGAARAFVELFTLSGFAVAQPLYDIFGRAPDQFIFRGALRDDILGFAAVILLAPPAILFATEMLVGRVSKPARRLVHLGFVSILVAVFAVGVVRSLFTGPLLLLTGVALGGLGGLLYTRTEAARVWLGFASVAPPVFAALFLLTSQTAALLTDPAAAGDIEVGARAPVVMIVFDELPLTSLIDADGTIDAGLYPNFAALASTSHWFRNTTTVSNFTWSAVPALVTGRNPRDGTTPTAASHPQSLFTLLGASMGLNVTESVTRLCPAKLCATAVPREGGLPSLLRDARKVLASRLSPDRISTNPAAGLVDQPGPNGDVLANDTAQAAASSDRAQEFLDGIRDGTGTVHFLHVLLPHIPFRYLPDGTQYPVPDPEIGRAGDTWGDQAWLVQLSRQRHLLQLAIADALVGKTIAKMKALNIYDDALFTVVADHGVSFQPGRGTRGLDLDTPMTDSVASEIMWVPFFVKEPGQATGEVDDRDVRTTDVLPTLADVLDVEIPWKVDGRSALGPRRTSTTKAMHLADHTATEVLAGKEYRLDGRRGQALVRARAVDRFLPGRGGRDRFWTLGPHPELHGTTVRASRRRLVRVDGALAPASAATDVRPSSGRVPALVRATLTGVKAGEPLAVAVGGTIRATGPAYVEDGRVRVAVMVPDSSFVAGANRIEIFRIRS